LDFGKARLTKLGGEKKERATSQEFGTRVPGIGSGDRSQYVYIMFLECFGRVCVAMLDSFQSAVALRECGTMFSSWTIE